MPVKVSMEQIHTIINQVTLLGSREALISNHVMNMSKNIRYKNSLSPLNNLSADDLREILYHQNFII
ncbi:hypothetical protein Bp8pS_215 [Bacillus phage vB_BpuM-BpSp]|nr:hypothetical protein Bp8pS_215 [Bacillus phage vB_BpuM-BpSp]